eukprot:355679-Chlamydomonas_euryale.AAC.5
MQGDTGMCTGEERVGAPRPADTRRIFAAASLPMQAVRVGANWGRGGGGARVGDCRGDLFRPRRPPPARWVTPRTPLFALRPSAHTPRRRAGCSAVAAAHLDVVGLSS